MIKEYKIVIVGAGMIGLLLAALLRNIEGLSITLIDSGSRPQLDNESMSMRVSAISPSTIEILKNANVWEEILETNACPFVAMRVWDQMSYPEGPESLFFDSAEFSLGQLGFIVENKLIETALLRKIEKEGISVQYGKKINSIERCGSLYTIDLEHSKKIRADLLVGADGSNSFVRKSAAIDIKSWVYSQDAIVTSAQTEFSHKNIAWQRFTPNGPVGILPLNDGRVSIIWSTSTEEAHRLVNMNDKDFTCALNKITDNILGNMYPEGTRVTFPLRSQYAKDYVQAGLALIGDAAHTVHPLAGQGANLGFSDAATLANVICESLDIDENPGDFPTLRKFERSRKGKNLEMLSTIHLINKLFSNNSTLLSKLRGTGMYFFNRSGFLRSYIVERALGIEQ